MYRSSEIALVDLLYLDDRLTVGFAGYFRHLVKCNVAITMLFSSCKEWVHAAESGVRVVLKSDVIMGAICSCLFTCFRVLLELQEFVHSVRIVVNLFLIHKVFLWLPIYIFSSCHLFFFLSFFSFLA